MLKVEDALKGRSLYRPVHRNGRDAEDLFYPLEQVHGLATEAIELVDERQDRDPTHPTYRKQLPRLRLDAFRVVQNHDGAIDGHEGAVRVLAEILVPRRIQQVQDVVVVVVELQGGRGDRYSAFLLDGHPIGYRVPTIAPGSDRAGKVDSPGVEKEFLGQGCLTGVRMGNDREGSPAPYLAAQGLSADAAGVALHPDGGDLSRVLRGPWTPQPLHADVFGALCCWRSRWWFSSGMSFRSRSPVIPPLPHRLSRTAD